MSTRSPNIAGGTYALMLWTPIQPGREDELRAHLEGLDTGAGSPLAKLPRTHMARWIVVPDMPVAPGTDLLDPLGLQFLLFTSNFDGDVDSYLHELVALMPEAAQIWGHCVGCPQPAEGAAFKAYLHRNQVDSGVAFAAYPDASVAQIRTAVDKRTRLIDFAVRAQDMKPAQRRKAFLKQFGRA